MEKVYVSLGADCGGAGALREAGNKTFSFPFDWLVCFHSAHLPFQHNFKGFLEDRVMVRSHEVNPKYAIKFFHRELIKDYDVTLQRRVDRLLKFLEDSDKELIFIRRSHGAEHHMEMANCGCLPIEDIDDVKDIMLLKDILISKYPNLKFRINLFLQCPHCNKNQQDFNDEHVSIKVSTQKHIKGLNLEPWAREFVNWVKTL